MKKYFDMSHDRYYMSLAMQVQTGADCKGKKVGAVVVVENRVVSTGYNGTPDYFVNCLAGGCVRCNEAHPDKSKADLEISQIRQETYKALDVCICVHAEQNAFLSAARTGVALQNGTLYTTWSPCFICLKEALQIGIQRVVYLWEYGSNRVPELEEQYQQLVTHLCAGRKQSEVFMKFEGDLACWNSAD